MCSDSMLPVIYLIVSTLVLAKSAEIVIDSATKLSRFLGISQFTIGLVLVSVITSLPELSVAIISSSIGEGAVSAGNVFGSNIANIFLALGLGAFLYGSKIPRRNIGEIGLVLLLTTVISAYIIFNSTIEDKALGIFGGTVLLLIFAGYMLHIARKKKNLEEPVENSHKNNKKINRKKAAYAFITFVAAIIIVFISSEFVVNNAVLTAEQFGIAKSVIGATIIAVGTSLPEIATSLQALRKKRHGIAVGNIVGSNLTNLTLVLGITAVINEIHVNISIFIAALLFAIVANAILLYIAAVRRNIGRDAGLLFIMFYAIFIFVMLGLQTGGLSV